MFIVVGYVLLLLSFDGVKIDILIKINIFLLYMLIM